MTGGQVDAGRQIQLPFLGDQLGHVADQSRPWPCGGEASTDQVGGEHGALGLPGQAPPAAPGDAGDAALAHQPLDPFGVVRASRPRGRRGSGGRPTSLSSAFCRVSSRRCNHVDVVVAGPGQAAHSAQRGHAVRCGRPGSSRMRSPRRRRRTGRVIQRLLREDGRGFFRISMVCCCSRFCRRSRASASGSALVRASAGPCP